ncbi:MAG: Sir2 family NAD-dependent protein deacetylase, partial [Candidatus Omnitrophota bacterium]|nr:Sir2 family NAD-dependent protein deacetylase [Candidatus Omnitrophota bacterium]
IKPTFAHRFLAALEKQGKLKGIVTQNIDSLHQMAGSQNVLEMHGSFWKSYCLECRQEYSFDQMKEMLAANDVVSCSCGGVIKPDIVFFGENVKHLDQSVHLAQEADLFFVIGSSCVVYPAAMLPQYTSGIIIVVNQGDVDRNLTNVGLKVNYDIDTFFQKVAAEMNLNVSFVGK